MHPRAHRRRVLVRQPAPQPAVQHHDRRDGKQHRLRHRPVMLPQQHPAQPRHRQQITPHTRRGRHPPISVRRPAHNPACRVKTRPFIVSLTPGPLGIIINRRSFITTLAIYKHPEGTSSAMKRYLVFAITAILAVLLLAGCQAVSAPAGDAAVPCNRAEVTQVDGKPDLGGCILRVAVENAYQPFNYIDSDTGKAVGYDYDIFPMICERVNCKPEFIETSWDAMVAVMGGEGSFDTFDVGADGITITEERAENVDFSQPLHLFRPGASRPHRRRPLHRAGRSSPPDPDLIIGTQLGSTNYDAAVDLVGEDRVTAFDQFGTAVQALINGDVDAVMIDNVAGIRLSGDQRRQGEVDRRAGAQRSVGLHLRQGQQPGRRRSTMPWPKWTTTGHWPNCSTSGSPPKNNAGATAPIVRLTEHCRGLAWVPGSGVFSICNAPQRTSTESIMPDDANPSSTEPTRLLSYPRRAG